MWGAVIGDIAGSTYEYEQYKKVSLIDVGDELIKPNSFFSDDTILTVAIYDAILHGGEYETYLRKYGKEWLKYRPKTNISDVFHTTFGGNFEKWLNGENDGTSIGNGAMMRISGVGKMFNSEPEVIKNVSLATSPSHNSIEAIRCAEKIALVIYYAKVGVKKADIINLLGINNLEYVPFKTFNRTCSQTINNCLYSAFTAHNFEEALRLVISMGGDTDTNGAIVGSMAEMLYGVPEFYVMEARKKIPQDFVRILDKAYSIQRNFY